MSCLHFCGFPGRKFWGELLFESLSLIDCGGNCLRLGHAHHLVAMEAALRIRAQLALKQSPPLAAPLQKQQLMSA